VRADAEFPAKGRATGRRFDARGRTVESVVLDASRTADGGTYLHIEGRKLLKSYALDDRAVLDLFGPINDKIRAEVSTNDAEPEEGAP
jgi:hypothetical protein